MPSRSSHTRVLVFADVAPSISDPQTQTQVAEELLASASEDQKYGLMKMSHAAGSTDSSDVELHKYIRRVRSENAGVTSSDPHVSDCLWPTLRHWSLAASSSAGSDVATFATETLSRAMRDPYHGMM